MADNQMLAEFLKQQKEEELRKFLTKDPAASTMYERQIIVERKEIGRDENNLPIFEETTREISVPKPNPEWLLTDMATTTFNTKDGRVKAACYHLILALSSSESFMEHGGKREDGSLKRNMIPTLTKFRNVLAALLLMEKSNDTKFLEMVLRQHVKQESLDRQVVTQQGSGWVGSK